MSKSQTRYRILNAIYRQPAFVGGATARHIQASTALGISTVRRHLQELRQDPTSKLVVLGDMREFRYGLADQPSRPAQVKRTKRTPKPAVIATVTPKPAVIATVTPKPAQPVAVLVLGALTGATKLGVHELGRITLTKRGTLQRELDAMVGASIVRVRSRGRWVYQRAS